MKIVIKKITKNVYLKYTLLRNVIFSRQIGQFLIKSSLNPHDKPTHTNMVTETKQYFSRHITRNICLLRWRKWWRYQRQTIIFFLDKLEKIKI